MSPLSPALDRERLPARRRFLPNMLTGLACALALAAAQATGPALSLAEAQRHAVERSRQLAAQDSALLAAREMGIAAGRLPDPVLKLGLDSWPVNGADRFSFTDNDFTMGRVAVSLEWTRAEKRTLRAQRFERASGITHAEQAALIAAIQRDTAIAWLDRYYAEAMAATLVELRKELELEIVAAEVDYRGGRGNQVAFIAAHSELVELDDRASEIDRRLRTAKSNLARWVGDGAELPLAKRPAMDFVRVDKSTLDTQLAHHPAVAVLTRQEELAWAEARLAEADKKADWSVEVAYAQRGSYADFVSVNLSIPLLWDETNRQDRELSARVALAEQAGAERDEAVRAHVADVLAQIQAWENGRERLARYERQLIPLAKARTTAAHAAFRGGQVSLSEILLARRDEIDLRLRMVQLELDIARLWAQLNFLFPATAIEGSK